METSQTSPSMILATAITKSFGSDDLLTHVLRGIDVSIGVGEFVAIMGKSGAGKSTLMYQLSVLDRPTSGSITINNTRIDTLSENERTTFRLETLGYVFQDYALVPDLSAEENVMLPLIMRGHAWRTAHSMARTAIDTVGLVDKYRNMPSELSGGEQQRIAIARAIAGTPKILFADEPTANLDSVSGTQIVALLSELHRKGQTIVMVTHEAEYAENCDRIMYMEDGLVTRSTYPHHNVANL